MRNILLVKGAAGTPAYEASRNYIDEWASALRKLGCNTYVLDGWSWAMPMQYYDIISVCRFDVVIDCNGLLLPYGVLETLPPEVIYGIYMHDHPGGLERLKRVDERTVVFNCDRQFCGYIDQYFPMIKHRDFIPLSGSFYPERTPFAERTIDIIFTGGCPEPEEKKEALTVIFQNEGMLAFGEDLMRDIILHPEHTFPECLSRMLNTYNLQLSNYEFNEYVRKHLLVDYYARDYYRDKLIRTLLDVGLEIHVFGNGWENASSRYPEGRGKLRIHDGGLYAARKAVSEAKIALNIMPWFKDGFQERIATAMLSKTIAVTDESIYINNEFEDGKDLVIFSLKELDNLASRIQYLLAHPKEAAEIAENGYRKAQSHTWRNRVYDMLRKIEEDFNISFSLDGEGRELEHKYSSRRLMLLDAAYELKRMADFAEQDAGKIETLSELDLKVFTNKFASFRDRFGELFNGLEMKPCFLDLMQEQGESAPHHAVELFSMQCKAIMGRLLLEVNGLNL